MSKWFNWTVLVLLTATYVYGYLNGWLEFLLVRDVSYLSLCILGLGWLGVAILSVLSLLNKVSYPLLSFVTFISNRLTTLGLLSTVVGLIIATIDGIPDQDVMAQALGTALLPTGIAIVLSVLLDALLYGDKDVVPGS